MTPKEYLNQAYKIERRINIISAKVSKLRSQLEYKGISYDGSGASHSTADSDGMSSTIADIADYERRQRELADVLIAKRFEIESIIDSVPNAAQREVLERRYLLYQRWESRFDERTGEYVKGIAEEMGYSAQHLYRIHGAALKAIKMRVNESE